MGTGSVGDSGGVQASGIRGKGAGQVGPVYACIWLHHALLAMTAVLTALLFTLVDCAIAGSMRHRYMTVGDRVTPQEVVQAAGLAFAA